ncbi:MAG: hypothetical protein JO219_11740 [Candidatus Eremiobacteraeota bacterium]|nr:hypothetical protein [Candidatus Eremiobacteraeota bacterium]MBV8366670.1 hypothetical protein [Candidatus Eremiobacteraeota bacterium]
MASWWLTYDANYSVAAEVFESPGDIYAFPEMRLVPLDPVRSASGDIEALRSRSGAFVREFRRCYLGGSAIGACAAVVNASVANVTLSAFPRSYTRALSVDDRNLFDGGRLSFSDGVPYSLGPGQAAALFQ